MPTIQHSHVGVSLNGQAMRANTIHRALMGPNSISVSGKPAAKKKLKSGIRKSAGGAGVSLNSNIRGHDAAKLYAANQPPRSSAQANRMSSVTSGNGSVNSKNFTGVKLRQDLSVKSNKSPNRYNNIVQAGARQNQQQTIAYNSNA